MLNRKITIKKRAMFGLSLPATLFSLFLLAVLTAYLGHSYVSDVYESESKKEKLSMKEVSAAIFYEDGYINSMVQPWCSDAQTSTGLTAHRLIKCTQLKGVELVEAPSGQEDDPALSYLHILKRFGDGCKVYYSEVTGNPYQSKAFFDCNLQLTKVPNEFVERDWREFYYTNFPQETIDFLSGATDILTDAGGTVDDGKFTLIFEK